MATCTRLFERTSKSFNIFNPLRVNEFLKLEKRMSNSRTKHWMLTIGCTDRKQKNKSRTIE